MERTQHDFGIRLLYPFVFNNKDDFGSGYREKASLCACVVTYFKGKSNVYLF